MTNASQSALPDDQRRGADPRRAVERQLDGQHQELAVHRRVFPGARDDAIADSG